MYNGLYYISFSFSSQCGRVVPNEKWKDTAIAFSDVHICRISFGSVCGKGAEQCAASGSCSGCNARRSRCRYGGTDRSAQFPGSGKADSQPEHRHLPQLQTLPGIGEVLAERILSYRDANGAFQSIGDLANVPGIDGRTLDAIWDYVTVGG